MSESDRDKPESVEEQPQGGATSAEPGGEAKPEAPASSSEPSAASDAAPAEATAAVAAPAAEAVAEAEEADDEEADDEQADDEQEDADDEDDDAPLDLESRVLCPDGSCIGVIGPDGRCKECGTALPEKERAAAVAVLARSATEEKAPPAQPPPAAAADDDVLDFSKRVLCSDGSCIGVIGLDGRCKECGKPYRGESAD